MRFEVRDGVRYAREADGVALAAVPLDGGIRICDHLVDQPFPPPPVVSEQSHVDDRVDRSILPADDALAEHLLDDSVPNLLTLH